MHFKISRFKSLVATKRKARAFWDREEKGFSKKYIIKPLSIRKTWIVIVRSFKFDVLIYRLQKKIQKEVKKEQY